MTAALTLAVLCARPPAFPGPQDLRHATGTINVEVPVRVFDDGRFVGDLSPQDFEVFEDGRPQKIAALYIVRGSDVRKAGTGPAPAEAGWPEPGPGRTLVLQFQLGQPDPRIDEVLDDFLGRVLGPRDALIVITPRATYTLEPEAPVRRSVTGLAREVKARVRKDLAAEGAELRRLAGDLRDIENASPGPAERLARMSEIQRQIRDRREIDPRALRRLAAELKARDGRKLLFLFYQRETVRAASPAASGGDSNEGLLTDWAATEARRAPTVGAAEIERAFADATVTVNFIFVSRSGRDAAGLDVEVGPGRDHGAGSGAAPRPDPKGGAADISAGFFAPFREMAEISGGVALSSANAAAGFKAAFAATENGYILYYEPDDYRADGRFREIEVRVKRPGCRVAHRAGYFADRTAAGPRG
ncbi:MAG TPA: VWA domain-containing protein [Candidatus Aminicenantes bacterium]|nr:VWA domain-containing protein [Candidatus Aminicenantes bacterium]HRY65251.1 VWA domain-containing protein [Candidatus Aminicenantes bacterium]HRZ72281.1 VWA domain-containing protein [Candidatus Aminicenantes bacterium]